MRTRTAERRELITEFIGYSVSMVLAVALLWPGTAIGQALPTLIINDANVFEGNSGTKIMSLPVSFVGAQNTTVTGVVSAVSMSINETATTEIYTSSLVGS